MTRPACPTRPTGTVLRRRRLRRGALALSLAVAAFAGCTVNHQAPAPKQRWADLPERVGMPAFLNGSIFEKTVRANDTPYNVSSYGLIGQLRGTGDCTASPTVRQYMLKELARRGFGDPLVPGFGNIAPSDVLKDPNYAIVRIDGAIPPGARKGDWFDVRVSCLPENKTTNLAHGVLFETELRNSGASRENPGGAVNVFAKAKGPIMVNPAYALNQGGSVVGPAWQSLRSGTVMWNGLVMQDRPILLQLRHPEKRMSRMIEYRVQERFQDANVAQAYDEGVVSLYVPKSYRGDWEHFVGVIEHLFLDNDPPSNVAKLKELEQEAQRPGAALEDISYCWEGLGKDAMPFVLPLLSNAKPEVAFAAARAAAFIGDVSGSAEAKLMQMARTPNHPFRISSVQVLGGLPSSSALNHMLRELLDSDQALVRIEAYKILARNLDSSVYTRVIAPSNDPRNEKFALDVVPSDGPPLIYATRRGAPRIAVIGRTPEIRFPVTYTALGNRFTLSSPATGKFVTMFYRDETGPHESARAIRAPVKVQSQADVPEMIARLGGDGVRGEPQLNFTYAEVLAIVQELADSGKLASDNGSRTLAASFVLQEAPRVENIMNTAPVILDPDATASNTPAVPNFGQVPGGGATGMSPR